MALVTIDQQTKVTSIKALAESGGLTSVPSEYAYATNRNDQADSDDPDHSIPTVDFSKLITSSPDQRSKVLHDLRRACEEWGFFMVHRLLDLLIIKLKLDWQF